MSGAVGAWGEASLSLLAALLVSGGDEEWDEHVR